MVLSLLVGLCAAAVTIVATSAPALAAYDMDDAQDPPTSTQVLPQRCLRGSETLPSRPGACRLTRYRNARPTIIVWGDSHAWQQLPAIAAQAHATRTSVIVFVMGACPPMDLRTSRVRTACIVQNQKALRLVARKVDRGDRFKVVLGAFWELYRDLHARSEAGWTPSSDEAFLASRAELFAHGGGKLFRTLGRWRVPTAAIAQVPWVPEDAPSCEAGEAPYACDMSRTTAIAAEDDTAAWIKGRLGRIPASGYIDTTRYLCNPYICHAQLNGAAVYLDDLHLDPAVTGAFAPAYRDLFR